MILSRYTLTKQLSDRYIDHAFSPWNFLCGKLLRKVEAIRGGLCGGDQLTLSEGLFFHAILQ